MVVCPSCKKKLQPPGAKFCAWCGAKAPISAGSLEEDRDALCALRTADSAIDKLLDPAFADYVVLANAGTTFTGRYMQIDGKKYNERLWCHKDGILDKKHTGLWYNDGQWRIGQTSNHWWTNATDPPLSGQWHGWEAGRHNLGGLPKFEATIVKRVEEDERVTALRLDWCSGIVTLPVEICGLRALTSSAQLGARASPHCRTRSMDSKR